MGTNSSKIEIVLSAKDSNLSSSLASTKRNIADLSKEVSRLGLMTETAFAKKNMALLDVKPYADVKAEMRGLTQAYVDLKNSGKASSQELSAALTNLRNKQRDLYASIAQPSKVSSARALLGVQSSAQITAEVNRLQAAFSVLKSSGVASASEVARAEEQLKKKIAAVTGEQQKQTATMLAGQQVALSSTQRLVSAIKTPIAALLGGAAVLGAINQIRKIADEYTNVNSRLKLVTESEDQLATVRERLYQISQQTGTEYAKNADSYAKLARSVKDIGGGFQDTLQVTELMNKSLTINGSTTEMASSFVLQFTQAMGSGVLQGEEFRTMMESNSFFASELAKALGTNIAGLRQMSKDGELTSAKLISVFPRMASTINAEFEKIAPTTARAMTMLENAFKRIVDESNQSSGGTGKIAQSIVDLATTIETNREGITSFFSFIIDMIAGATDKVAKFAQAFGNIGQSASGWNAVFSGRLDFFEFATMDAKELNAWLKQNVQELNAVGSAGKKAGADVSGAAKQSAATQKQVTGAALDEMKKQYKSYADEVKKLQASIADEQRSAAEEMRDMARSGMDDEEAWRDRKKEAQEYITLAQLAANAGRQMIQAGDVSGGNEQFKLAAEYAAKAQANYKGLNEEVKRGDTVIMTQAAALQIALQGYKQASDLKTSIMQQQADALNKVNASLDQQAGGQLSGAVDTAKNALAGLSAAADEAKGKVQSALQDALTPPADGDWGKVWSAMESGSTTAATTMTSNWDRTYDQFLSSGSEAIDKLESKLQELVRDRNIKVYVEEVQSNARGGYIQRMAGGGVVPGYSPSKTSDNILSWLTAREFVEPVDVVDHYQPWVFEMLRQKKVNKTALHAFLLGKLDNLLLPELPKFAIGGPVGFATGGPAAPSEIHALDITLGGSYAGRVTGTPLDVRKIKKGFQRAERLRS